MIYKIININKYWSIVTDNFGNPLSKRMRRKDIFKWLRENALLIYGNL